MGWKSFFAEVRRRHVFRVAAWYAVAAWLVIQIATNTFPHLMFPDWTIRFVIVLCLIGFPIAIAMAWSLEITPEGLKVVEDTPSKSAKPSVAPWQSLSFWLALAGGVLLGVAAVNAWRAVAPESKETVAVSEAPAVVPARVLAVLPFDNLGGDEANAAFTAGIHDSLITRIAKIGGMTVISRTSVMGYAQNRPNLKDIAKALGVTHVVEGSVQRAGEQVRIQAQLIDAATDAHLWAESYDRTLAEGFATQNEIATAIAQELSVRLSDKERSALQSIPTKDAEAFEHYVLGKAKFIAEDPAGAIDQFELAVKRDPDFALAFAELSLAHIAKSFTSPALVDQELVAAKKNYEQALALRPDLPEGILSRGVYLFRGVQDPVVAEPDLVIAAAQLPNNYQAQSYLGALRRRQGRWEESARFLERAAAIEPGDLSTLGSMFDVYIALRQPDPLEQAIRRAQEANPKSPWPDIGQAWMALTFDGDIERHVASFERLAGIHTENNDQASALAIGLWRGYFAQGRYREAANVLESFEGETWGTLGHRAKLIGLTYREAGDPVSARIWFEKALSQQDSLPRPERRTELAFYYEMRAYIMLGLGRTEEATECIRQALARVPRELDEVDWAAIAFEGSQVFSQIGDMDAALDLARQLMNSPTIVTPYDLWFAFEAAPLRANPEFRELMARHGVDVSRDPAAEYAASQAAAAQTQ